jgi:hypothetical protein
MTADQSKKAGSAAAEFVMELPDRTHTYHFAVRL